jgi:hypothetical protein
MGCKYVPNSGNQKCYFISPQTLEKRLGKWSLVDEKVDTPFRTSFNWATSEPVKK